MKSIEEHMQVIGADGVHIGTVDRVENGRIKLTKADSGEGRHKGHHHFIFGAGRGCRRTERAPIGECSSSSHTGGGTIRKIHLNRLG